MIGHLCLMLILFPAVWAETGEQFNMPTGRKMKQLLISALFLPSLYDVGVVTAWCISCKSISVNGGREDNHLVVLELGRQDAHIIEEGKQKSQTCQ